MHYIKFHIKTLKIAPTCFDPKIILRELHCSLLKSFLKHSQNNSISEKLSHYITHDAHHSQTHPQQRTLTQHDMLPQHPVNIMELFCECFKNDFSKEQCSSLRMILGSKHVGAILRILM